MLKIAIVVLKSFFCSIYNRIVDILECHFQVFFIFGKTCTIYPVQGNVCTIGASPLGRIASVSFDSFQYFVFQLRIQVFFTYTHLYE